MAGERCGDDVSDYLSQNPQLAQWIESFRGYCESNKHWSARRKFLLRNMEASSTVKPGMSSSSLDRLLSLSMVWANHVFLGCRTDWKPIFVEVEFKRQIFPLCLPAILSACCSFKSDPDESFSVCLPAVCGLLNLNYAAGFHHNYHRLSSYCLINRCFFYINNDLSSFTEGDADGCVKRAKATPNELESRPAGRTATWTVTQKAGPPPQAPAEHQPFFNRLYKAVAWKLVSAGGFGPNLDHFEILRSCVESCKQTLTCVFVPLKDITGLPAARTQKDGHVCEIRCQTVYMGTGYGRDESAAKAMASKEALKVFQGRKVTVKICRRRYKGRDVEDLMLLDEQPRSQGFPPALSCPFLDEQLGVGSS
ncbi:hypothetical protein XENOCAPTIV_006199 [Xenoophorus captivus]|uniref:XRN2-binding (XTBD) domain-containing protein n=1 Tax=Xenoophorus captivus TaxID=1517983 RepID=A0ABV0RP23_9TELE